MYQAVHPELGRYTKTCKLGITLLSLFTLNVATKSPIPVEWVIIWQPQPCFHYFRYGFHSEFEDCMGNRVTLLFFQVKMRNQTLGLSLSSNPIFLLLLSLSSNPIFLLLLSFSSNLSFLLLLSICSNPIFLLLLSVGSNPTFLKILL